MATKIDTVSSRDRLKPRREPYWHRVSKGCYLGFRKMVSTGHGNWIARAMQESSGRENYKALGDLSELPDHLRFDAAQEAALSSLLSTIQVAPFDEADAASAARLKALLASVGRPIGAYDLLIAGQALARNWILVTANTREFSRVPGLVVEDWTIPA